MRFFGWQVIAIKLVSIALAVGGFLLIIEVIPREFWYVLIGCIMIFAGWSLFKNCD